MESEVVLQRKNLPQLSTLRIDNLTTFPGGLEIRPLPGVTVIFGGNYSGKTTIVNAIKFGLFGLTLNRTDEELSARYFSSRIRERERKSLDIITSFKINRLLVTVKRTLFSSGPQQLDVQVLDEKATPGGAVVNSFSKVGAYLGFLAEAMGLESLQEVEFVLNLLMADEDRHAILWHKDCERISVKLLLPEEEYAQLKWLDQELEKKKSESTRVSKSVQALAQKLDREQAIAHFLESASKEMTLAGLEEKALEYERLLSERDQTVRRVHDLQETLTTTLDVKSKSLAELSDFQLKKRNLEEQIDRTRLQKLKTIMHSDDPEGVHIVKHLVHEKRCPFCEADLSSSIDDRVKERLCIFCGNEIDTPRARGIEELNNEIHRGEENERGLVDSIVKLMSSLQGLDVQLTQSSDEIRNLREKDAELTNRLGILKDVEAIRQSAAASARELLAVRERIQLDVRDYETTKDSLDKLENERQEILALQEKGRETARGRTKEVFQQVRKTFAEFVSIATNGEMEASLSGDMLPTLGGRKIFAMDDASQFERGMLDVGFRLAVVSSLAEKTGSHPLIVLETPDEVSDESYLPHLAKAIARFANEMSIVITSSNTNFMKALLEDYDPSDRKRRLIDLSTRGTDTQRSYYAPLITEWTSSSSRDDKND